MKAARGPQISELLSHPKIKRIMTPQVSFLLRDSVNMIKYKKIPKWALRSQRVLIEGSKRADNVTMRWVGALNR